jgi:hypothetical protein
MVNDLAQQASGFWSNRENYMFWKNWMFQFAILDVPVCSQCTMLKSILLNQVQQNWMFQNKKSEGPIFPEVRTIWAKQRQSNLWIGGQPWYVI